jgi:hypothetical protein
MLADVSWEYMRELSGPGSFRLQLCGHCDTDEQREMEESW